MLKPSPRLTLQYLKDCGHDQVKVPHDSIVGYLEDGSVSVGVDGGDHLRLLYPGNVLKLPGYPEGEVEGWSHRDAGEADMKLLGEPAIVGRKRSRAAEGTPDCPRQVFREAKVLLLPESSPGGDD